MFGDIFMDLLILGAIALYAIGQRKK